MQWRRRSELILAHRERNQPNPSISFKGVDRDAVGKKLLSGLGHIRPVKIGELSPRLTKDSAQLWRRIGDHRFKRWRHGGA